MNPVLLLFSAALVVAQFALPRRWAFLPLLIAACHTPYNVALAGQFTAVRLVLLAGLLRAGGQGLVRWNTRTPLDIPIVVWSALALVSALGHEAGNPFIYRAGLVLNVLGTYLYARAYIRSNDDFGRLVRGCALVLLPLAFLLAFEAVTGRNAYHSLGTRLAEAVTRNDRTRAMGPFGSPILAGTVGAVVFPLFVSLWRRDRTTARIGIGSSLTVVIASASSGPIGTLILGCGALYLWRWRQHLGAIKVAAVAALVVIQLIRDRSAWYLISLIDFVGGSTGWHRSRLLESATLHVNEWWLMGTDYTRHWMPYGLPSNPNHVDLTSYYVHLGVIGGLPLVLALMYILWKSFRVLGRRMRQLRAERDPHEFVLWSVGSAIFAHAVTFLTISYFDQLYVFFYATIGAVPVLVAGRVKKEAPRPVHVLPPQPVNAGFP